MMSKSTIVELLLMMTISLSSSTQLSSPSSVSHESRESLSMSMTSLFSPSIQDQPSSNNVTNVLVMDGGSPAPTGAQQLTTICRSSPTTSCKPSAVEFFPSLVNRDSDKIMMLSFDEANSKLALCAPDAENSLQVSHLSNQINLMSHTFCRQMGYMTYVTRRATNVRDDRQSVWPSAVCNGTEQRLEDCYWPEVQLSLCNHVVEVHCGDCSKYFSHVDDGTIMTPGFPASFPFTIQCDWLIYTQLGVGLELKFPFFNFPSTQLPTGQIGSSSCAASNAFIEIRPSAIQSSIPEEVQSPILPESDILSNSQRYCVTRNPERKMLIKSKAVWIHFSSGIHSPELWSYFKPKNTLYGQRRPVGMKIHFKALPAEAFSVAGMSTSANSTSDISPIKPYLSIGVSLISGVVIVSVLLFSCIRYKNRKSKKNPNFMTHIETRTSASRADSLDWLRTKGMNQTIPKMKQSDPFYEEVRSLPPPILPPRRATIGMTLSGRPTATRSESGPASVGQDGIQRTSSSFRSPPTYASCHETSSSRHYMAILCDTQGNCQYIPREEIGLRSSLTTGRKQLTPVIESPATPEKVDDAGRSASVG